MTLTCWGHHAQAVGRRSLLDLERCDGCGRKIKGRDPKHNAHYYEDRVLCTPCAQARHVGCPLGEASS